VVHPHSSPRHAFCPSRTQAAESTNEKVAAMARSLVGVQRDLHRLQRDMETLKDRVMVLTVAVDEHPPAHPELRPLRN
jgi:hypothetical protein